MGNVSLRPSCCLDVYLKGEAVRSRCNYSYFTIEFQIPLLFLMDDKQFPAMMALRRHCG